MRGVRINDYKFIHECYQDWPLTDDGPVTEEKAIHWTRRWIYREDEKVLILEDGGEPVGLIKWRQGWFAVVVDNIVVHPAHRGKGYASQMIQELYDKLTSEGVVVAEFEAIPGPIQEMIKAGKFIKVKESFGKKTGFPTIVGRMEAK